MCSLESIYKELPVIAAANSSLEDDNENRPHTLPV
jgi:hypothetical protein